MKILRWVLMLIVLLTFFKFTNAFTGLIAEDGDYLSVIKWNELVFEVSTKLARTDLNAWSNITITGSGTDLTINSAGNLTAINTDREDSDLTLTRYYGTEYSDFSWKIDRETGTGTGTIRATATNLTNAGQANYSTAFANRTSLSY